MMKSNRKAAIITGALFLIAMVTSLVGGGVLESILNAQDYLTDVSANTDEVFTGVFFELMNGIAVVGIAVMMFPILKQHNESIAIGYVGFRIIEAIFCIVSAVVPLMLLTLSQEYLKSGVSDASNFQTLGTLLLGVRTQMAGLLIPIFFCLGALLFYGVLYQFRLVPRFISVWGLIGVVLVLALNLVEVSFNLGMILALPIILNEIFLGIWLIAKGFTARSLIS